MPACLFTKVPKVGISLSLLSPSPPRRYCALSGLGRKREEKRRKAPVVNRFTLTIRRLAKLRRNRRQALGRKEFPKESTEGKVVVC